MEKNEIVKCIGLELADVRNTKGYNIIEVANKTNINKDTIGRYENGNSSMKIYIISILLDFYNVNIASFFTKVYDRMQNIEE